MSYYSNGNFIYLSNLQISHLKATIIPDKYPTETSRQLNGLRGTNGKLCLPDEAYEFYIYDIMVIEVIPYLLNEKLWLQVSMPVKNCTQ